MLEGLKFEVNVSDLLTIGSFLYALYSAQDAAKERAVQRRFLVGLKPSILAVAKTQDTTATITAVHDQMEYLKPRAWNLFEWFQRSTPTA